MNTSTMQWPIPISEDKRSFIQQLIFINAQDSQEREELLLRLDSILDSDTDDIIQELQIS